MMDEESLYIEAIQNLVEEIAYEDDRRRIREDYWFDEAFIEDVSWKAAEEVSPSSKIREIVYLAYLSYYGYEPKRSFLE